jgi:hypothetical protein
MLLEAAMEVAAWVCGIFAAANLVAYVGDRLK